MLADEGELTNRRSRLVDTSALSKYCSHIGLDQHIRIREEIEVTDRIREDVFEAFLGAMYLDLSTENAGVALESCQAFMGGIFSQLPDLDSLVMTNTNYKGNLVEHFQQKLSKNQTDSDRSTKTSCVSNENQLAVHLEFVQLARVWML